MATTHFKLTEPNRLTRRVTFINQPTWHTLAARIESFFAIPVENVSVSYIDADNDQVTLSSEEELEDFYKTSHQPGQVIKFIVQDLTSARSERAQPQTTHSSNIRNTFGIGSFDIEDDWQSLPIPPISELGGLFLPNSSNDAHPHAFVEVLESDASTIANRQGGDARESVAYSSPFSSPDSPFIMPLDKGKERAVEDDDISSTGSVLAENAPPKHPVHVYDLSSLERDYPAISSLPAAIDLTTLPTPIAAESTPKINTQTFSTAETGLVDATDDVAAHEEDVADPPLPSLESQAPAHTSPSLSSDIAALLNIFSNVVGAHPELSEGIRNIVRNTSSGTYWQAHREAMSRAAQDIAQETANLSSETEQEAGRRVAEALGGIFRTLSQTLGASPESLSQETTTPAAETTSMPAGETTSTPAGEPTPTPAANERATGSYGTPATGNAPAETGSSRGTEQPPAPYPPYFNPWIHRGPSFGRWGQRIPHPPPFGPPRGPPGLGGNHMHTVPPPPLPPMPGSWQSWVPSPGPPPPPPPPFNPSATNKPTPQELRAQVDAAKAHYKAEKERYRQEREERRKERERRGYTAGPEATAPVSVAAEPISPARPSTPPAVAVHGKGGKPTHEVVSVHRHHTHLGHGFSRRHGHDQGDMKFRAVNRISKRLGDMGFTENAYPDLVSKVKAELPSDGVVTKDAEDNIVTTLLEELLAMSPKPVPKPVASGSRGARN